MAHLSKSLAWKGKRARRLDAGHRQATNGLARMTQRRLATGLVLSGALALPTGCTSSSSSSTSSDPQEVVTALLQDIKAGRIDDAYRRFGQRHLSMVPRERFVALVDNFPLLRDHVDLKVKRAGSGGKPVPVQAELTSASGEARKMSFYMVEEGRNWAIGSMQVDVRTDFPGAGKETGLRIWERDRECSTNRQGTRFEIRCHMTVAGFAQPPLGEQLCSYKLVLDCEVTGPDGRRVERLSRNRTENAALEGSCGEQTWAGVCDATLSPEFPPGPYALRVRVSDGLTGATVAQELADFVFQ